MRIARLFIPTLLLFLLSTSVSAQNQAKWHELINQPNVNYNQVKAAFEREVAGLGKEEAEAHYKHFNRWCMRALPFAQANGDIMNATERMNAFEQNLANKRSGGGNWKEIGPFTAKDIYRGVGRVNSIAFHPTDSNIMWAGAPYGGVWKTEDYGNTWRCLTDHLPSFGVTGLAVDPTNPDIIYAGTGDGETGRNPGFGVWKSTDGGQTWEQKNNNMGNVIVNDIVVYEDNPNEIIAATATGIFWSTNGGDSWGNVQQVSSTQINGATGVREIRFKPDNHDIVYAVSTKRFFKSENRGRTWTTSVPTPLAGQKLSVAVSAAEPNSVWLIDEARIYKSTDAGENIEVIYTEEGDRNLGSQSWYNTAGDISPIDPTIIYQGHVPTYVARDSITNWTRLRGIHSDVHFIRHSPVTGRLWVAGDGGIVSLNDDKSSFTDHTNMGVAEIYEMSQHPELNDHMLNGYQDCGTKYYVGNGWKDRVGADGMDCVFDPDSADIYFTTIQYGDIRRHIGGPEGRVSNFPDPQGNSETTRGPWVSPIWLDRKDPNILYTAQHSIYRYKNCREDKPKKENWEQIDNGLSALNRSFEYSELEQNKAAPSIFYTLRNPRNLNSNTRTTIFRTWNIHAEIPIWQDITDNLPSNYPLQDIETSATDSMLLFVCSFSGDVLQSINGGESFVELSDGLPELPIYSIQYDNVTGNLYAGTEVGVYVLPKGESTWLDYSEGMSLSAPVYEIEIFYNPENHDNSMIKAATFGRGMWESPLYGTQPDPTLPFYAFIKSDISFLEEPEFFIEVSFRRGWSHINVKDFDANKIEITNAEVVESKGQQNAWLVKCKAINEGEITIKVPSGIAESESNAGLFNMESEEISFINVQSGVSLGYEGPAGLGSLDDVAVWLNANSLLENYNVGDEVSLWFDELGNGVSTELKDTLIGPALSVDTTLFNGNASIQFTENLKTVLIIDSVVTGKNISAFTVAASNDLLYNEHAWLGSSRTPNGFILHNYEDNKNLRMMAYDSNEQVFRSPYSSVADPRQVHLYGMAYRENVYIWNYTDEQEGFEPVATPKPRYSEFAIDIQLGADRNDRFGSGRIAEHIVFNEALMKSHRTILYNYLSEKYDSDLGKLDHFNLSPPFNNHMAGIGKESSVDFHNDAKGPGFLRVNNPTDLNNGEYLFWASNGRSIDEWVPTDLAVNNDIVFEKSEIEWQFTQTGSIGSVSLLFDKNDLDPINYRYFLDENGAIKPLTENNGWFATQSKIDSGTIVYLLRLPVETVFSTPKIYPTILYQTQKTLTIQYEALGQAQIQIAIYNSKGQSIYEEERNLNEYDAIEQNIDLEHLMLGKGTYIIHIKDEENEWTQRFVVVD
ncbi:MAG: T9SS type A sorting domain-containing protein [Bacteroidia bacterium]